MRKLFVFLINIYLNQLYFLEIEMTFRLFGEI